VISEGRRLRAAGDHIASLKAFKEAAESIHLRRTVASFSVGLSLDLTVGPGWNGLSFGMQN
jgi:hypothetical protein